MAGVLDPDTHIAEPPQMWDYLEPEWRPRHPDIVNVPDDTVYGGYAHMQLSVGTIFPKGAGRGGKGIRHRRRAASQGRRAGGDGFSGPMP